MHWNWNILQVLCIQNNGQISIIDATIAFKTKTQHASDDIFQKRHECLNMFCKDCSDYMSPSCNQCHKTNCVWCNKCSNYVTGAMESCQSRTCNGVLCNDGCVKTCIVSGRDTKVCRECSPLCLVCDKCSHGMELQECVDCGKMICQECITTCAHCNCSGCQTCREFDTCENGECNTTFCNRCPGPNSATLINCES